MSAELPPLFSCYLCRQCHGPGNQVRQDGMWKIPAWKAIAKCLLQGVRYTFAWTGLWWLLAALLLLPVFLRILQKKNWGFFSHPLLLPDIPTDCSAPCPVLCSIP